MALTNNLKRQVDLPVWEWCRFAPLVSAAGLCTCSDESSGGRYIYYLSSATTFHRYDTVTDGWQVCQAPTTTAVLMASMRYTVKGGMRGNVLGGEYLSVVIPGLQGNKLVNQTIRIVSGTGAGQERTITAITHEIVEHGSATTGFTLTLTDAQVIPKKWTTNQWAGYQCRLVFGTGQSQVRKILYNNVDTLTFSAPGFQPYDSWNNTGFSAVVPSYLPVLNSMYFIEKSTATVAAWDTVPDATSKFVILSGGIWLTVGTTLALGCFQLHYYDILSDFWVNKTKPGGVVPTLGTSDVSLERCGEISGAFDSGDCDASAARTMVDATKAWAVDRYANYQVRVTKTATGVVQRRRILGNTASILYIDKPWDDTPDTNFTWKIYGDTNAIWLAGNGNSSLYKYMVEEDLWTPGQDHDSGICRDMSYHKAGTIPFHATTVVNTAGIKTINATPSQAGTGYKVGEILNVTQAAGGKVRVASITPSTGAVLTLELFSCGTGTYTAGTGKATSYFYPAAGGVGSGCQVDITLVGDTAKATTATGVGHNFKVGDVLTHMGSNVARAAWNTTMTVLCADTVTTFEYLAPEATAPTALWNNGTALIVDSSKNWTVNEHKGKMVTLTTLDIIPTSQIRKITANSATTLTVATLTAQGVVGTSRYVIYDMNAFGRDSQYKIPAKGNEGWATAGSNSVTLEDTTKDWIPGQWVGYTFKVLCGTGFNQGEIAITANTATTLTMSGFTPDLTTKYRIMDTWGIANGAYAATTLQDTTKKWAVNQWVGKTVRLNCVSAGSAPRESIITGNTIDTLTFNTITQLTDAMSCYTILDPAIRQIGIQAMWNYGGTIAAEKGRYLFVPRGGSAVGVGTNMLDRYDIALDKWDVTLFQNPQGEIQTLGSQWCYDGGDYIYWSPCGATGTRIFRIHISNLTVDCSGQNPYAHGAGVAGNRMEIITTVDGLEYLYLMRSTGAEWWRTLLFWT